MLMNFPEKSEVVDGEIEDSEGEESDTEENETELRDHFKDCN